MARPISINWDALWLDSLEYVIATFQSTQKLHGDRPKACIWLSRPRYRVFTLNWIFVPTGGTNTRRKFWIRSTCQLADKTDQVAVTLWHCQVLHSVSRHAGSKMTGAPEKDPVRKSKSEMNIVITCLTHVWISYQNSFVLVLPSRCPLSIITRVISALCRWINGGGPWRPNLPSDSLHSLLVGLLGQTAKCFMGKVGLAVCGFLACPLGLFAIFYTFFHFLCAFEWSFRTCLISGSLDGSSDPNKLGYLWLDSLE